MKKSSIRIRLFIILMTASVAVYIGYKAFTKKTQSAALMETAYRFSDTALLKHFKENGTASSEKFSGKVIEVMGSVKGIEKSGYTTVLLGNDQDPSAVVCSMDSSFSSLSNTIPNNEKVTIKGICTGYIPDDLGLGISVQMNRCVISE